MQSLSELGRRIFGGKPSGAVETHVSRPPSSFVFAYPEIGTSVENITGSNLGVGEIVRIVIPGRREVRFTVKGEDHLEVDIRNGNEMPLHRWNLGVGPGETTEHDFSGEQAMHRVRVGENSVRITNLDGAKHEVVVFRLPIKTP